MTMDPRFSRRRFLQLAAVAGGAAAAPIVVRTAWGGDDVSAPAANADPGGPSGSGGQQSSSDTGVPFDPIVDDGGRILVVIHLDGGNDGLNTVVPLSDQLYSSVRGEGAVPIEDVYAIDDTFGLASMPYLAERWAADELAIVHGVGVADGSLSHFAMSDIWEAGSPDSSVYSGWLGRAIEARFGTDADPLLGVCAGTFSRALSGDAWAPFTLPSAGTLPWSSEFETAYPGLVTGLESMTGGVYSGLADSVIDSHLLLRDVGQRIDAARPDGERGASDRGRGRGVGRDLDLVADVINAGLGTRVFHLRHGGFDTHANQLGNHPGLLAELDSALEAFHARLGDHRDRVVVMTWTEFGRRVAFNGSGTDHGTSSAGFVLGPTVRGGHHGEVAPLDRLDRAGNLAVTTDFRDYLAGVCSPVLEVDAEAIASGSTPLEVMT